MTLSELRDALSAYPDDHLSPVRLSEPRHSGGLYFVIKHEPGNVADLKEAVASGHVPGNLRTPVLFADTPGTSCAFSHTLLRAWLGPVPVVLPEGCSEGSRGRQYVAGSSDVLLMEARVGEEGLRIELTADYTRRLESFIIPDAALHWLRTGEVTP